MKSIRSFCLMFTVTVSVIFGMNAQHHNFAFADYTGGRVFVVENDTIVWQHPAPNCNDLWVLPNGNLLFTTGHGVLEMTRGNDTVFTYQSTSEIYACQRLEDGNTFIGESNAGRLLEVTPSGRIVKEIKILPDSLIKTGHSSFMRNARKLKNGNYLVAHFGGKGVCEYSPEGEVVWEVISPGGPHTAIRLPDGNTLVSEGDAVKNPHVYEFDSNGKVVWEVSNDDLPGKPFKFLAGMQRLPDGNTVICNWLGHEKSAIAPHIIEVTRDKKVVWSFTGMKGVQTVSTFVSMESFTPGSVLH